MHELSLCRSIAGIAREHARGRPVATVRLRVGRLRQVVPDTLVYCWELVVDGTDLDGSVLEVESVPGRVRCDGCGDEREMGAVPLFACPVCGGAAVVVVRGEEFLLTSLELTG